MKPGLLEEITSRGYWRINFRPITPDDMASLSLDQCREVVTRADVSLRGWNYPHVATRQDERSGLSNLNNCVECWTDFMSHREFWRMYTSSQFLHYRAVNEDWRNREAWDDFTASRRGQPIQGPTLGVTLALWHLAEVFEFLARLNQAGLYRTGAAVSVELHNGGGSLRTLWVDERSRAPFSYDRTNAASVLRYTRHVTAEELQTPKDNALGAALVFFDKFGWNPQPDQLLSVIEELYAL